MTARILLPEGMAWPHHTGWLLALVDWLADLGVLDPSQGLDVCGRVTWCCTPETGWCVSRSARWGWPPRPW